MLDDIARGQLIIRSTFAVLVNKETYWKCATMYAWMYVRTLFSHNV